MIGKLGARHCSLLFCVIYLSLAHVGISAQDMPIFSGNKVPLAGRPQISGKSGVYTCAWERKTQLLRKDMYILDPSIRRQERISISHNSGETVIAHSGTGTFEAFAMKATIADGKSIRFDTPPLINVSERRQFVFLRAAGEVFSYWRIAVRPYTPGPTWRDPALVAALAPILGGKQGNQAFGLEETGIDLDELSFVSERNAYLETINRSLAYGCTLNKRWAAEDCVLNALGWVLYDRETGIKIEQDVVYTLMTGEGLSSVASATWRERSSCQPASE